MSTIIIVCGHFWTQNIPLMAWGTIELKVLAPQPQTVAGITWAHEKKATLD